MAISKEEVLHVAALVATDLGARRSRAFGQLCLRQSGAQACLAELQGSLV